MDIITHPNGIAPVSSGQYQLGAKGGRMAQAWQHIWDQLDREDWKGSLELAEEAAAKFNLKKVSVSEMLCRMRASGVIEQRMIAKPTTYVRKDKPFTANRPRVHYRIAARDSDKAHDARTVVNDGNF